LSALQAVPLPDYSFSINVAKNANLVALKPMYLGVLLESSEYDIQLPHDEYFSVTGSLMGCCATLKSYRLKIITHETLIPLYQELILYGVHDFQKITFFIIPNLFEMSCK
jgi:hypothetical protein